MLHWQKQVVVDVEAESAMFIRSRKCRSTEAIGEVVWADKQKAKIAHELLVGKDCHQWYSITRRLQVFLSPPSIGRKSCTMSLRFCIVFVDGILLQLSWLGLACWWQLEEGTTVDSVRKVEECLRESPRDSFSGNGAQIELPLSLPSSHKGTTSGAASSGMEGPRNFQFSDEISIVDSNWACASGCEFPRGCALSREDAR